MASHLPGPWRAFYDSAAGCWVVKTAPCQFNARWLEDGYTIGCFVMEDDAKLVAAGPEMLVACQAAKLALRATSRAVKDYSHELELLNVAIRKALD
jgi:hypothetical protein